MPRKDNEPGKGAFWTLDPENTAIDQFQKHKKAKRDEEDDTEDLIAVDSDPDEAPSPAVLQQSMLQNTIKQYLLDPIKHPLPASIAQLLPQAIAQLPPGQISTALQTALGLNKDTIHE